MRVSGHDHVMKPLTKRTGKRRKFEWTSKMEGGFQNIKSLLSKDTLLVYPLYSREFVVYTDSSSYQLGGVMLQERRPIAIFLHKLTQAQQKYTTTDNNC